ncbi:nitroreductase family protein [Peptoniphilus equinus]|uniref:Nitroreductase family protein n=1 Tax=Peptoniphilus equinus TaxID=3016343 RepID=A0ABY7QV35_9FIRM|nr:nitroreductase family protein [Peptoniphilus equinus]WBW50261.1 nitroreductase family protein [Peptoniphilus equinus]
MFKDLIKDRHTIRTYKNDAVDFDTVKELLKFALMGPSYKSARPIEFLVVDDKPSLEKLAKLGAFSTKYLADVPLCIITLAHTDTTTTWLQESAVVTAYFQLLAKEEGLDTAWVNIYGTEKEDKPASEYLATFLDIPAGLTPVNIIPVGYGDERVRKRKDFDISDKIHFNTPR